MADYCTEEEAIPQAEQLGEVGPLRCLKCGAYVNPRFNYAEHNAAMVCNFCGQINKLDGHKYSAASG